jgi:hypothetical protein
MFWVIFVVGLVVIGIFALVATGAFGELKSDNSLDSDAPYDANQRIPLVLFGYQKSRVDKVIQDFQAEIDSLKSKKK